MQRQHLQQSQRVAKKSVRLLAENRQHMERPGGLSSLGLCGSLLLRPRFVVGIFDAALEAAVQADDTGNARRASAEADVFEET